MYKIVSNGEHFKIQKKGWFFWNSVESYDAGFSFYMLYNTLELAEKAMEKLNKEYEEHKIAEEIKKRKWKTVDTTPNSINFIKEKEYL